MLMHVNEHMCAPEVRGKGVRHAEVGNVVWRRIDGQGDRMCAIYIDARGRDARGQQL